MVVADFGDLVGDSLLAAGITEAFRVDLSQSPLVRVMSARQVAGALERMEQPPNAALNAALARELAAREGAKAIVTGSVANVGGSFTVNVQLVSTAQGEVLAALRETAAGFVRAAGGGRPREQGASARIGESLAVAAVVAAAPAGDHRVARGAPEVHGGSATHARGPAARRDS